MTSVLILNGPNLNLLGTREPDIYGHTTLDDIRASCESKASQLKLDVAFEQSNHEGELVDWIQGVRDTHAGLIINAGAFTHTSVAIHDALLSLSEPIIELHISNVFQREEFRHQSYISKPARAVICGFGAYGYEMALDAMAQWVA